MKSLVHGMAVLSILAAALPGASALAQDKIVLTTDREKASYMIGRDIAESVAPVKPDLDIAEFERAVTNSVEGGPPLLKAPEAKDVSLALMARVRSRAGQAEAGTEVPPIAKDKASHLVGAQVGQSLVPIKDEIVLPVLLQSVRAAFNDAPLQLSAEEVERLRKEFSQRVQLKLQERAKEQASTNQEEGKRFLAENKAVKGVFTTPSGLQYMVLRQGSGERPKPDSRVRVHYEGKLLDGTVFDSSYEREQPAEFGLKQVIAGWTEGLGLMPVGAKYRFWIPADLAYGTTGAPPKIGPNATLTFDVELLAIIEE
ncbi:MAG: FKBP-type peptidyl-prolyl cis-trans isomerase [Lysobacter sp.]|nr:FKBP-type peptidyl-prolyl cis-trans isomerase [Lysobacter sp.]